MRPSRAVAAGLAALPLLLLAATVSAATRYDTTSTVDATVRNCPPSSVGCGYVIGHATPGDTFDVTYKPSNNPSSWSYGYLYGDFDHCGWMQNGNIDYEGGHAQSLCSSLRGSGRLIRSLAPAWAAANREDVGRT